MAKKTHGKHKGLALLMTSEGDAFYILIASCPGPGLRLGRRNSSSVSSTEQRVNIPLIESDFL